MELRKRCEKLVDGLQDGKYACSAGFAEAIEDLVREVCDQALEEERKFWADKFKYWEKCQSGPTCWVGRKLDGFRDCYLALQKNDRWIPAHLKSGAGEE